MASSHNKDPRLMLHPRGEVDNKLAGAQWDCNEGNPVFYFQKLRLYDYT